MEEGGGMAKRRRVEGWRLEAVLGEELVGEVELVGAVVVEVLERRAISALMKVLAEAAPLGRLQHLKRVRSSREEVHLLLWPEEEVGGNPMARLAALGAETAGLGEVVVVGVAARQPATRRQFDGLRARAGYWPTAFHEDKEVEALVAGKGWVQEAREEQERMLGLVGREGGVVVEKGRVVARGSGSALHPLAHTAMVLVDLVARTQGGGAWHFTSSLSTTSPSSTPSHPTSPSPSTSPSYLCTGCTVYLAREPCHLCAMALLHSRAAAVVFRAGSRDGALATADRLQERKGINHRFAVYRVAGEGEGGEVGSCC